jgi:hypothetical protein
LSLTVDQLGRLTGGVGFVPSGGASLLAADGERPRRVAVVVKIEFCNALSRDWMTRSSLLHGRDDLGFA